MLPFFVFAGDELAEVRFKTGIVIASYCHEHYVLGKFLFEFNEKGDQKNAIPRIREELGDKLTSSILNYAENEKDPMKQNQFLDKLYYECIEQMIATGELQKP
jgi:hypothetical protein